MACNCYCVFWQAIAADALAAACSYAACAVFHNCTGALWAVICVDYNTGAAGVYRNRNAVIVLCIIVRHKITGPL